MSSQDTYWTFIGQSLITLILTRGETKLKALCVDDEKLMLQHLVSLCEKAAGISETHGCGKAKDALAWLEDHPCDIVLLDISMPDMDGITLARKIREIRPGMEIVFVTGHQRYALDAWSVHPSGFLLKPVSKKDLQKELDYILSLRSSCRHA